MNDLVRSLGLPAQPVSWGPIVANIAVAFVLGIFIAALYRGTHRQLVASYSLIHTLILLSMIMAMVIMVIGDNIARAFGMAGAMSIVRFRTVVKDTRDTAFVFYALGAGMAAGTGHLQLALMATPLVGLFVAILHWTRFGVSPEAYVLSFETESARTSDGDPYADVFRRHLENWNMLSARSVRAGTAIHHAFQVRLRSGVRTQDVLRDLGEVEGVLRVQLSLGEETED